MAVLNAAAARFGFFLRQARDVADGAKTLGEPIRVDCVGAPTFTLSQIEQQNVVFTACVKAAHDVKCGDATTPILKAREEGAFWTFTFAMGDEWARYVVEKGSVALDGISLTVAALLRLIDALNPADCRSLRYPAEAY